ncbi:MAG: DUF4433 domain-containing protein [Oscillospiraceae bacterium]|jgi:hypothetical protein|nr:DUF4433 domain-containing protein [Oscillospiraceae bacterium]
MSAYDILAARGVTRLCHFTKFQSLTHIIPSADGILASNSIRQDTKNVIDAARYGSVANRAVVRREKHIFAPCVMGASGSVFQQ